MDLELRNFIFKVGSGDPLGVGHIKFSNLPVTAEGDKKTFSGQGKASLTPGDLPGIMFWMASGTKSVDMKADGYVTADGLAFVLDFKMPRMQVPMKVKFGQLATTGLPTVAYEATPASVFTLDGRRLEALPARAGIYIVGGRKMVR